MPLCGSYPCMRAVASILCLLQLVSATGSPAPIVVSASGQWDGIDGPWSSLFLETGSPQQTFRVLVSLAVGQTWLVTSTGCPNGYPYKGADCAGSRGGLYNMNASNTLVNASGIYKNSGVYSLNSALGDDLGFSADNGAFGFDNVSIAYQGGSVAMNRTIIAGIGAPDYWLGEFGISPQSFNITSITDQLPSFFAMLRSNNLIPSLSYSFNAGSYFRRSTAKSPFMSLIFGGYDASRFVPNNVRFTFNQDAGRELVVGIQSITGSSPGSANTTLMNTGILAKLDSSQAYLWLPNATCSAFEQAFGLVWDQKSNLYLVNDTLHQALLAANPSITFTLGNTPSGGASTNITMPYGAFDLTVSPPLVPGNTSQRYFPLKRAADATQYILGRAFLQEAYITVDYERNQFNVSQALWDDNLSANVQTIASVSSAGQSSGGTGTDTTNGGSNGSSGLSTGAIAGIAVGGAIILILMAIAAFFLRRRRIAQEKKRNPTAGLQEMDSAAVPKHELDDRPADPEKRMSELADSKRPMSELADSKRPLSELEAEYMRQGMFNVQIDEIVEMEGGTDGAAEMESPYEGRQELESPGEGRHSEVVSPIHESREIHELDAGTERHWGI